MWLVAIMRATTSAGTSVGQLSTPVRIASATVAVSKLGVTQLPWLGWILVVTTTSWLEVPRELCAASRGRHPPFHARRGGEVPMHRARARV
jgi:hypothetical protein